MGVTLLLAAILAQAPLAPGTPAPTIVSVEVRLPAGADPKLLDRVPSLITVRKGQPLSRRAVQRAIENLFATGRFSDVEALAVDVADGVEITFSLTPRRVINEVYFEGNRALTAAELQTASRLAPNAEYWPERLEAVARTITATYARRGFRAAKVTARVDEDSLGATIGFSIEEGTPSQIASITLAGEPGLELRQVLEAMKVKPGDVLDMEQVEAGIEALRELYRKEHFFRARVEVPQAADDARLVVPVTAGPRYQIVFSGNRHVSDSSLKALLAYNGEELLDGLLAQRLAAKLVRFYRFRGFHDVRVTPSEVLRPGSREAALGFAIEEGAPIRVVDIAFDGNDVLSDRELKDVLRTVVEASAPQAGIEVHATNDPGGLEGRMSPVFAAELPAPPWDTVLDEGAWAEAAKAMTVLYRERGYLKASVKVDSVTIDGQSARGRFVVLEGPRAVLRKLDVHGLPAGFKSDTLASVKVDAAFNVAELDRIRQGVTRELGRQGYLFANVEADYALDAAGTSADCVVTVSPGPQVRVRAIVPVGNARTADDVVLKQAAMLEGMPLDAETLFSTQSNLLGLGIFRSVEVEMLSADRPEPLKTVLLKVRERPRVSGEFGIGYFLAEGPRLVLDMSAPNLGGRAVNFNAHGQLNFFALSAPALSGQVDVKDLAAYEQLGGRGNLSVQSRSLLPESIGLRFDVVIERVFRPQFRFTRLAGVPTIDWVRSFETRIDWLRPKLTLALQYELEWSRVLETGSSLSTQLPVSLLDQERLRFRFGNFALHTGRFSPTIDLRDNALNPRKGLLLQGAVEATGALFAEDNDNNRVVVQFLKTSGLATAYVPLGPVVLALSARAGRIFPLAAGSSTPPVKRFFLGGATSMRGFNEDQLIAEDSRAQFRSQVNDCQVLAVKDGCTSAARTIMGGRQVPSQGGELFALMKAELRFPALGLLNLGVFFETGNLWLAVPTGIGPLRSVAGAGARYVTPIGPLALDFGVNLSPDKVINEPSFVVHFNIGVF